MVRKDTEPTSEGLAADNGSETQSLTAIERVQLARHADRPHTLDFIERLFDEFVELHGDRRFAEDPAIVCGSARFHGLPIVVVGQTR